VLVLAMPAPVCDRVSLELDCRRLAPAAVPYNSCSAWAISSARNERRVSVDDNRRPIDFQSGRRHRSQLAKLYETCASAGIDPGGDRAADCTSDGARRRRDGTRRPDQRARTAKQFAPRSSVTTTPITCLDAR